MLDLFMEECGSDFSFCRLKLVAIRHLQFNAQKLVIGRTTNYQKLNILERNFFEHQMDS